jgi:magnesium transporter
MKNDHYLLSHFAKQHPEDVADILLGLDSQNAAIFLNGLKAEEALGIIQKMDLDFAAACLEHLQDDMAAEILTQLSRQRAAVLLRQIQPSSRKSILDQLPKRTAHPLAKILSYSDNSAGALADSVVLSLPETMSAKQAQARLKQSVERSIYYIYIVDDDYHLKGVLDLRVLLQARPDHLLSSLMEKEFSCLSADQTIQSMLVHPGWQSFHVLPVITDTGALLGAITFSMLRQAERELQSLDRPQRAESAIQALGDLYQIGLLSLLPLRKSPSSDHRR